VTDIFREVEEDVRQEQLTTLLQDHWPKIVGVIVALIVAFGAYNYWLGATKDTLAETSTAFEAALEELAAGNEESAASQFAAIRTERGMDDYGLLSAFREAQALAGQGNANGAVKIYDDIAQATGDDYIESLAAYYAGATLIAAGRGDEGIARLKELEAEGGALGMLASEMQGYALYAAGKRDEARDIFLALREVAPEDTTLGQRVAQMLLDLGVEPLDNN
jgi:hypothetical protein